MFQAASRRRRGLKIKEPSRNLFRVPKKSKLLKNLPDRNGHFGIYGGRYVPETLMSALAELEPVYRHAKSDPSFKKELAGYLHDFAGRPTPLTEATRLAKTLGLKRLFLKREDLLHTGSHKINNTLGQALLTRRMQKKRVIAETGAGQ